MSIRFTKNPLEATAVTHGGKFHADDVLCCVLLEKLFKDVIVYRSAETLPNNLPANAIIFDIGNGEFDHHQKRGNGYHFNPDPSTKPIPYSAFGLLWKKFGYKICQMYSYDSTVIQEIWNFMNDQLVIGVDAIDNGIYPILENSVRYRVLTISNIITWFNSIKLEQNSFFSIERVIGFARIVFDVVLKYAFLNATHSLPNLGKEIDMKEVFVGMLYQYFPNTLPSDDSSILSSPSTSIWGRYGVECLKKLYKDGKENQLAYIWIFVRNNLIAGTEMDNNLVPNPQYMKHSPLTLMKFCNLWAQVAETEEEYKTSKKTAIYFFYLLFYNTYLKAVYRLQSKECVEEQLRQSRMPDTDVYNQSSRHILVFDQHIHWQEWVTKNPVANDIWFIVTPSVRGGYSVHPVQSNSTASGYRKGFPKAWYGLRGQNLENVSGVSNALFIHQTNGFIGAAADKKSAIMLALKASSFL